MLLYRLALFLGEHAIAILWVKDDVHGGVLLSYTKKAACEPAESRVSKHSRDFGDGVAESSSGV